MRTFTELCDLRVSVETFVALRAGSNANAASASAIRSAIADTLLGASRLGTLTFLVTVLHLCGNHTAKYRGCVKWKEAKAAIAKQAPAQGRWRVATNQPSVPKAKQAGISAEQMDLGEGWSHVVCGARVE